MTSALRTCRFSANRTRSQGRIHAASLLAGALLAGAVLVLSGAAAPNALPTQETQVDTTAVGAGLWRDLVRIEESDPYTVPEGKVLILQGCGFTTREASDSVLFGQSLVVIIDGVRRLILDPTGHNRDIPAGWAVNEKSQVALEYGSEAQLGYLFGFLVDA